MRGRIFQEFTFAGLKQILKEKERVFLGKEPQVLGRVRLNPTKYIASLQIDTYPGKEKVSEKWFQKINIPLNSELVAIIGNKGSGKSAIADIIGMCVDSEHSADFQFLNANKFKKKGLADRFFSHVKFFGDTKSEDRSLFYDVKPTSVPLVQYLPQHYFENICNEIGKIEGFRREIEKVVFQYLPTERRLKSESFSDLIMKKKEGIESEINSFLQAINNLNKEIIQLEDKLNPLHLEMLENLKAAKERDLKAICDTPPSEKINPFAENVGQEAVTKTNPTEEIVNIIDGLKKEISVHENNLSNVLVQIEELQIIKKEIIHRIQDIKVYLDQNAGKLAEFLLTPEELLQIDFKVESMDEIIKNLEDEVASIQGFLKVVDLPNEISDPSELPIKTRLIS